MRLVAAADAGSRRSPGRRPCARSPVGASPGTLIADPQGGPVGAQPDADFARGMPRSSTDVSLADVEHACEQWPLIWLDCVGLANIELIAEIGRIFGLHPLALEDVGQHRPAAEGRLVRGPCLRGAQHDRRHHGAAATSRSLSSSARISSSPSRSAPGDPFDPVRKRIEASNPNRLRARKADYLAYALIDAIVDSYFPPVEAIGDRIDAIEDEMLGHPQKHQVRQLHRVAARRHRAEGRAVSGARRHRRR